MWRNMSCNQLTDEVEGPAIVWGTSPEYQMAIPVNLQPLVRPIDHVDLEIISHG